MENDTYKHKGYMLLPVVLAMACLLMVAVVAVHGVCAGVSGCSLYAGTQSGSPDGRTETATYSHAAILQFAKRRTGGNKPSAGENLAAHKQFQSSDERK